MVTGAINPRVGVDGKNYAIGFQLSLPDRWNGRFLFIGGGGNDGILRDTSLSSSISGGTPSPLGQGFAVVSTDAGHTGTSASFGADPQARIELRTLLRRLAGEGRTVMVTPRDYHWMKP